MKTNGKCLLYMQGDPKSNPLSGLIIRSYFNHQRG